MIEQKLCFVVVHFAEALIAWQFLESIFVPKQRKWKRWLAYILGYGVSFAAFNMSSLGSNVFVFTICNFLLLLYCYRAALSKSIFYALILSGLMLVTESLSMLLLWVIYRDFDLYQTHFAGLVLLSSLSKVLYFIGTRIYICLIKEKERDTKFPSVSWLFLSFESVTSLVVILGLIYMGLSVPTISWPMEIWMSVSALVLLLSNIVVFASYQHMQHISVRYAELLLRKKKEEADEEYYTTLKEQYENQRILIHDVRHHLDTIKTLAEDQPRKTIIDYVTEMEHLPELQRRVRYSGNPVLNVVAVRYSDLCLQKGISFSADLHNYTLDFMDALDITALFGNLLENALEAAEGSQNAFVELTLNKREPQGLFVLSVINSCAHPPKQEENGNFLSGKINRKMHGLGIQSIDRTVKKYGGHLTRFYDEEQGTFHTIVTLCHV